MDFLISSRHSKYSTSLLHLHALWISATDCKNNNFDANIGRFGMNFKNDKPDEGPHSVVVEYCFPHISVFPSIFLKQN